jgi:hypothetical protein
MWEHFLFLLLAGPKIPILLFIFQLLVPKLGRILVSFYNPALVYVPVLASSGFWSVFDSGSWSGYPTGYPDLQFENLKIIIFTMNYFHLCQNIFKKNWFFKKESELELWTG